MTEDNVWMRLIRAVLFLPDGRSTFADAVDLVHAFTFAVTMAGLFGVIAFTIWCMFRYRSDDPFVLTPRLVTPLPVEVAVIGGLLSLFFGVWVAGFVVYTRMTTPPDEALDVYVTAKQWMWKFAYPDGRSTAGVLVVPVDRPVRLVMTSRDVIHSFFVPQFRVKQDLVPGRYTVTWFQATRPGTYPVYCAEFCGFDHAHMRAHVVVLSASDWAAWDTGDLRQARAHAPVPPVGDGLDMAATGRGVAARKGCINCHTVDGTPHLGPTWVGLYGSRVPLQDGATVLADEAYLTESMMDPEAKIHAGFVPIMPTFEGRLTVDEVGALVEYIRALADGPDVDIGDVPPPADHRPGEGKGRGDPRRAPLDEDTGSGRRR